MAVCGSRAASGAMSASISDCACSRETPGSRRTIGWNVPPDSARGRRPQDCHKLGISSKKRRKHELPRENPDYVESRRSKLDRTAHDRLIAAEPLSPGFECEHGRTSPLRSVVGIENPSLDRTNAKDLEIVRADFPCRNGFYAFGRWYKDGRRTPFERSDRAEPAMVFVEHA